MRARCTSFAGVPVRQLPVAHLLGPSSPQTARRPPTSPLVYNKPQSLTSPLAPCPSTYQSNRLQRQEFTRRNGGTGRTARQGTSPCLRVKRFFLAMLGLIAY